MIRVDNLTKFFGPHRSLDGVSFNVEAGDILGFLGPNGAGKSTTMRCLVGLVRPSMGSLQIDGRDVQKNQDALKGTIGFMPEQAPLYGDMTLESYLRFVGGTKDLDHKTSRSEMERTSDILGLTAERRRILRNLSKGTRQRAALAAALIGDPKTLILDEPTAGLDPGQIGEVRALIKSMRGKRTVILSTHILPEVELSCSRIAIIAAGRIVAKGTRDELLEKIERKLTIRARGNEAQFREALAPIFGNMQVVYTSEGDTQKALIVEGDSEAMRAKAVRAIVDAKMDVIELSQTQPTLEDVFLRVTGQVRER